MRLLRPSGLFAIALIVAGCGDGTPATKLPDVDPGTATYKVRESIGQLAVTHAAVGEALVVVDGTGAQVATGTADKLGSYLFRKLPPGSGYLVRDPQSGVYSRKLTVMSLDGSLPSPDFYSSQKLDPGYHYITTRDGTTLSAYVTLPGPPENGPYPTIVDYSGYSPSKPGAPVDGGKYSALCGDLPTLCDAPNDPSAMLSGLFGFATVSVNIRGTGCSGGAFDYYETLQITDGYDIIETVAAQPWVLNHQVGMTGLSFPGITQLFVAQGRPPGLAAITPLSVIDRTINTMFPGGILNGGFAIQWVNGVLNGADPYGQGWEKGLVDAGDTICGENQLLHGQKVDNVAEARMTKFYDPALHEQYNPDSFVGKIDVPVFMTGGQQDEQTGPFYFTLFDKFTSSPASHFTTYNGVHADGFAPQMTVEWVTFLQLFVARKTPAIPKTISDLAPILFQQAYGSLLHLPPTRFDGMTYDQALAAWKAEPRVRALFEMGTGDASDPGAPSASWEKSFASWPPPGADLVRFYFQPDGSLASTAPTVADGPGGGSSFGFDADAGNRGLGNANVNDKLPTYDWQQPAAGKAISFVSAALAKDTVMLGSASVDLYVRSTAVDADLQVSVTEVRPDGKETYVQSGWLRASRHLLDASSTALWPVPTYLEKDYSPLKPGEWTPVRLAIPNFGHAFRAGSRIRVIIDTPGGTRAAWRFDNLPLDAGTTHAVSHSAAHPSSIALSVLTGVTPPTALPACPSLRGQPCRTYVPYTNTLTN